MIANDSYVTKGYPSIHELVAKVGQELEEVAGSARSVGFDRAAPHCAMMPVMRSRVHTVVLPSEVSDFADEIRQVFIQLGRSFGIESLAGECSPALDMFETDDSIDIRVDLPGADPAAIRVLVKQGAVLIAGEKAARRVRGESSFHLVERGFGRFARVVQLSSACDAARARATLHNGELRISFPKIAERRGKPIAIAISPNNAHPVHR
jgi:HSP20 family protein